MADQLLILAVSALFAAGLWIADLIHRCGIYRRHMTQLETRLEERWYAKGMPDGERTDS